MSACYPTGHVARKKQHCVSDIIGCTHTPQGTICCCLHELVDILTELRTFTQKHRRLNIARTYAIHTNVVLAMVDGHCSREIERAAFGRAIRSGARAPLQRPSGAGVDDASSAVLDHVRDHFVREKIDALQGHVDGADPFFLSQFNHIFPDNNPCVVAEDVDFAETYYRAVYSITTLDAVANIAFHKDSSPLSRIHTG